mgnify:FL=1
MVTETGYDSDFDFGFGFGTNAESYYEINSDVLSTNKYLYLGFDLIEHNTNNKKLKSDDETVSNSHYKSNETKLTNQSEIQEQAQNEFDELLTKIDKFNIK